MTLIPITGDDRLDKAAIDSTWIDGGDVPTSESDNTAAALTGVDPIELIRVDPIEKSGSGNYEAAEAGDSEDDVDLEKAKYTKKVAKPGGGYTYVYDYPGEGAKEHNKHIHAFDQVISARGKPGVSDEQHRAMGKEGVKHLRNAVESAKKIQGFDPEQMTRLKNTLANWEGAYEKEKPVEETKKSLDTEETTDELRKSIMLKSSGGRLEWAEQFAGSPQYVEALKIVRDNLAWEEERAEWRASRAPYNALQDLPRSERERIRREEEKKEDALDAKRERLAKRAAAVEKAHVEHRIAVAGGMSKAEDVDHGDTLRKSETSGFDALQKYLEASGVVEAQEFAPDLQKAGPFIGPKGGKWADAKHTIPWKEGGGGSGGKGPTGSGITNPDAKFFAKYADKDGSYYDDNEDGDPRKEAWQQLEAAGYKLTPKGASGMLIEKPSGSGKPKDETSGKKQTKFDPTAALHPGPKEQAAKEKVNLAGFKDAKQKFHDLVEASQNATISPDEKSKLRRQALAAADKMATYAKNPGVPTGDAENAKKTYESYMNAWGHELKNFKKSDDLTPEKARQILHDGTVHGNPITEQQRKYFGAVASGKVKKSMSTSGLDALAEVLEKADGMPSAGADSLVKTKSQSIGGSADGGSLEGTGATSGGPTDGSGPGQNAQGILTGTDAGKKEKLSEDDAEETKQMTTHKKPIEMTAKSMAIPGNQRDMVAQENAAARFAAMRVDAEKELRKSADEEAANLAKSDGFYLGDSPSLNLRQDVSLFGGQTCTNDQCGASFAKSLSACPECNHGAIGYRSVPGTQPTQELTTLRKAQVEEDISFGQPPPVRVIRR